VDGGNLGDQIMPLTAMPAIGTHGQEEERRSRGLSSSSSPAVDWTKQVKKTLCRKDGRDRGKGRTLVLLGSYVGVGAERKIELHGRCEMAKQVCSIFHAQVQLVGNDITSFVDQKAGGIWVSYSFGERHALHFPHLTVPG
jgi:hypothetical protein